MLITSAWLRSSLSLNLNELIVSLVGCVHSHFSDSESEGNQWASILNLKAKNNDGFDKNGGHVLDPDSQYLLDGRTFPVCPLGAPVLLERALEAGMTPRIVRRLLLRRATERFPVTIGGNLAAPLQRALRVT